jgi:hypothetical protein
MSGRGSGTFGRALGEAASGVTGRGYGTYEGGAVESEVAGCWSEVAARLGRGSGSSGASLERRNEWDGWARVREL